MTKLARKNLNDGMFALGDRVIITGEGYIHTFGPRRFNARTGVAINRRPIRQRKRLESADAEIATITPTELTVYDVDSGENCIIKRTKIEEIIPFSSDSTAAWRSIRPRRDRLGRVR